MHTNFPLLKEMLFLCAVKTAQVITSVRNYHSMSENRTHALPKGQLAAKRGHVRKSCKECVFVMYFSNRLCRTVGPERVTCDSYLLHQRLAQTVAIFVFAEAT